MNPSKQMELERFASILSTDVWPVAIVCIKPSSDDCPGILGVVDTAYTAHVSQVRDVPVQQLLEYWLKQAVMVMQSDHKHDVLHIPNPLFKPSLN